ncbi:MAG TPA: trypsin-like serine protease [Solirubrobacterales bacterium]|nr:trypsin-like serine protease [Solirubrobacterales bacterium]
MKLGSGLPRLTLPALIAIGLLAPALAGAAPPAARRVPGAAGASRFWGARRIRQALDHPARPPRPTVSGPPEPSLAPGRPRRVAGTEALISSVGIANTSAVEDRTNGRVFGIDPRLGPYSCSGTSLDTPNGSMVLTAGHCVVEARRWGRDLVFIPAFDHGRRPFGAFPAETVYTTPQWRQSENTDFDVAVLQVKPNQFGTLAEVVGSRGYVTGRSRFTAFQIFGYPAGALDGEELRSCMTHGLGSDPLTIGLGGPPTVPSRCNMAAGSSGGAWLAEGQYINGLTSYGYARNFTRLYSPYFGAAVGSFLSGLP